MKKSIRALIRVIITGVVGLIPIIGIYFFSKWYIIWIDVFKNALKESKWHFILIFILTCWVVGALLIDVIEKRRKK